LSAAAWPGAVSATVQRPNHRTWLPPALAAGGLAALTLAVPVAPALQFAYRAPGLHVALETTIAVCALLATTIVLYGWTAAPRLDRLAIAAGLAVLAVSGATLTALLAIAPGAGPRAGIGIAGTLVGAALLAVGAFASDRRLGGPAAPASGRAMPRRPAVTLGLAGVLAIVAVAVVTLVIEVTLVDGRVPAPEHLSQPTWTGRAPAIVVLQLAIAVVFALAAFGLTRRGAREEDAFARRLGLAAVCFAFAKLHYLLLPPVGPDLLHAGDVLKLLFGALLLWAAGAEVAGRVGRRAAERERRRIARDLHDGVAQELAFIYRRAARLTGQPGGAEIAVAAERALLDSRWAIERLARPPDEPLERVLARHAAVVAARTGVAVTFTSSGTVNAGPEVSEALARILGEAVANARHGHATRVHVKLTTDPLRLLVSDDGVGFDPAANRAGFGLLGMRERAALVGAELSVRSAPGTGTEVAVELPSG
jgi:signal transduction histidine kinase